MKKLILSALLVFSISISFSQLIFRDGFVGEAVTNFQSQSGTFWREGIGEGNGWNKHNGIFRPTPSSAGATPNTDPDIVAGHSGMAYWDSSMAGNWMVQLTMSEETPPYAGATQSTLEFYVTKTTNALFGTQTARGYKIAWTRNVAAPGTPDNWTIGRIDTLGVDATIPLTWKKSGSNITTASLNKTNTVMVQVRKDAQNTIALLIGGIVVDSLQDTVEPTLDYFQIRGGTGQQTQLDNFYSGPYTFVAPIPPPLDTIPPTVGSNSTSPGTGSIDSTRTVTATVFWNDDSTLYRDSIWEVGVNTLVDTVLSATHNNIFNIQDQISTVGGLRHVGVHYYWSSARDFHGNYRKSAVFSYRVDTVSNNTQTSGKWVTGYYPDYANVPRPGQLNWKIWTHIVHFVTRPSLTYTPDPVNAPFVHHFTFDNTITTFENAVGNQNYPVQRQLIDTAHAHGRKVLIGMFGSPVPLYDQAPETLKSWISSWLSYAKLRGYDGVDFDWEWPGSNHEGDVWNYMIRTVRDTLNTWSPHGIISAAWFQWVAQVAPNIDWNLMNTAIDQNNIMCYDMEYGARNVIHAPLNPTDCGLLGPGIGYGTVGDNIPELINQYTLHGLQRSKIGAGVPFYGYQHNGSAQFCTASGGGSQIQYFNIFPLYQGANASRYTFDNATQTPYLSWTDGAGGHFISFDDSNSAAQKAAWVLANGVGGLMVWEMSQDVARPDGKYIITEGIGKGLGGNIGVIPPNTCNLSITPHKQVLLSPANGATNQPSTDTLKITPQAGDTVSYFELEIGNDSSFQRGSLFLDDSLIISFPRVVTGLQPSLVYYWHVRARNCVGNGTYSNVRSFTTASVIIPPPPPPSPISDGALQHYNGAVGRMDFAVPQFLPVNNVPLSGIPVPPSGVAFVNGAGVKDANGQVYPFASLLNSGSSLTTTPNTWAQYQTFAGGFTVTGGTTTLGNATANNLSVVGGGVNSNLSFGVNSIYNGLYSVGLTTNPALCVYSNDFIHVLPSGVYVGIFDSTTTNTRIASAVAGLGGGAPPYDPFSSGKSVWFEDCISGSYLDVGTGGTVWVGTNVWQGAPLNTQGGTAGLVVGEGAPTAADTGTIGWWSLSPDRSDITQTLSGARASGGILELRNGSGFGGDQLFLNKVGSSFKIQVRTPSSVDSLSQAFGLTGYHNGLIVYDTIPSTAHTPMNAIWMQIGDSVQHTTVGNIYGVCAKLNTGITRITLQPWTADTVYTLMDSVTTSGIQFYVNGILRGTISTNVPTGTAHQFLEPLNRSSKVWSTDRRALQIDKMEIIVPKN